MSFLIVSHEATGGHGAPIIDSANGSAPALVSGDMEVDVIGASPA